MKIISISVEDYKTVVEFKYSPKTDLTMYINSQAYIKEYGKLYGPKYMIKRFVGKELDKIYSAEGGETYTLILEFQKIPAGITNIEVREPDDENGWEGWYWKNIKIKNPSSSNYSYTPTNNYSHKMLNEGYFGSGTLNSGEKTYWKYYVPAGTMAVFTLKNTSYVSDFDIYSYSDTKHNYLIESGENYGSTSELITMPLSDYGRYIYIKIENDGTSTAKYKLNAHYVDFIGLGEQAIVEAGAQYLIEEGLRFIFDIEDDEEQFDDRDMSRASTLIMSGLKGDNLTETTKSLLINEVTSELRDEFGYGFWGDLFVNYGIGIINETYKYY